MDYTMHHVILASQYVQKLAGKSVTSLTVFYLGHMIQPSLPHGSDGTEQKV